MAAPSTSDAIEFQPLASAVDVSFWHALSAKKIDEFKLDSSAVPIACAFTSASHAAVPSRLSAGSFSFDTSFQTLPAACVGVAGRLVNCNTLADFKALDRVLILQEELESIAHSIRSGQALREPESLNRVVLTSFADLKTHRFIYWFAFPSLNPTLFAFALANSPTLVTAAASSCSDSIDELFLALGDFLFPAASVNSHRVCPFFAIVSGQEVAGRHLVLTLAELVERVASFAPTVNVTLAFVDPASSASQFGWPLRQLLALIDASPPLQHALGMDRSRSEAAASVSIMSVRDLPLIYSLSRSRRAGGTAPTDASRARSLQVRVLARPIASAPAPSAATGSGWEKNERGKFGPRSAELARLLDPHQLAESSVDLNLRLMRWRIVPSLQLDKIQSQRCLLLGAGTLGCVVARSLLAWGVRHITLVDSGKVSFSNPVRQWLFEFNDCLDGGKSKAAAAAAHLKAIFPSVHAQGVDLQIPMPGHVAAALASASTSAASPEVAEAGSSHSRLRADFEQLNALVESHDVVFLLTDSRESRWLPTLLSQRHRKLCVNIALGFDTFLVMRHGLYPAEAAPSLPVAAASLSPSAASSQSAVPRLSCYFCADVVAPTDSLSDRTLDMQCTVSRPGLAPIAAALGVELLSSLTQHPLGAMAPVPIVNASSGEPDANHPGSVGCLGVVPHQIRGSVGTFGNRLLSGPAFDRCIACSPAVLDAFRHDDFEFVLRALVNPTFLEDLTGLTELKRAAEDFSVDWDEDDEELDAGAFKSDDGATAEFESSGEGSSSSSADDF